MSRGIPVTVTAKNEERLIERCLDALSRSLEQAERRLPVRFDLRVVLDDCSDGTAARVQARGIPTLQSTGGKVEAQRRGVRKGPFNFFSDADIEVDEDVVTRVTEVMLEHPEVQVAFPRREPFLPRRRTPLARALHLYNLHRGFASKQGWFTGKFFAIRRWSIPARGDLSPRVRSLPVDAFYDFGAGIRADDIYLSRALMSRYGPGALRETGGTVRFRAPETWEGMYRYYRRLRMELERTDALCPETREAHARFGTRTPDLLAGAPGSHRAAYRLFQTALVACRARYQLERVYYQRVSPVPCDGWKPVEETKCP